ncbi:MAG TPA: hypothetical protein VK326_00810 [Solirubrobacterales bacterium]|nr:hypothetical protein [Solirubrobacterales bacterium]
MPEPAGDSVGRALDGLAAGTSRRGFLARIGGAITALTAGGLVARAVRPGEADAFHFCGHIYTTGSCLHPTGLPRIDGHGYPLRASDGQPVDDLARPVNHEGSPVDHDGEVLRDPDGRPLPPAPRTKVCEATGRAYGFKDHIDGGWYRCCDGHVRKLVDCCAYSDRRINGDAALHGYCFSGRKVFCVMYYETKVPC